MSRDDMQVLTNHRMSHITELKVHAELFEQKFKVGCSMENCDATCCSQGVLVDPMEKERILSHAGMIVGHMDPDQKKDPSGWFDNSVEADADFPSGRAEGTQASDRGCVFLKQNGHCVLQVAASGEGMHKFALKPFFCVAFPVTVDHGVLVIEDPEYTNRKECCAADDAGRLDVIEVLAAEFEFMLGENGLSELRQIALSRQT